jgi:uncharacterized protein (DUF1015 family)
MPGMTAVRTSGTFPETAPGLVVRPFRGLHFDPRRISDLARVTSPPYDAVDPETLLQLETEDPHNVVRLILPRDSDGGPEDRYQRAARTLRAWRMDGAVVRDDVAGLYAYEQSSHGQVWQRGLIGAVALHEADERVILPHEDVMAAPVADRVELMRATRANLEPILLAYDGDGESAGVLDRASGQPAVLDTVTRDGVRHRLWPITDSTEIAALQSSLAPRQALIADGHHRYAAYLRLRAEEGERQAAGSAPGATSARGSGPLRAGSAATAQPGSGWWETGLALLVDNSAHPLTVRAIHRVVAGLDVDTASQAASGAFRVIELAPDSASALAALAGAGATGPAFLLTDGRRMILLDHPDVTRVMAATPAGRSPEWRALGTAILHDLLIARLWAKPESAVTYHHEVEQAFAEARRANGTAVLLNPVTVPLVRALAERGETMPRKTTSFGPKPRSGIVLRSIDD